MDYIRRFDIELERTHYYAGEKLRGWVVLDTTENIKVRGEKPHVTSRYVYRGKSRSLRGRRFFKNRIVQVYMQESISRSGIRVVLRGKAHVQWTIMRGGEARIAQQDQYFIDEKRIIWGKG